MSITRRQFGTLSAGVLGSSLTRSLWAREAFSTFPDRCFRFAVTADSQFNASFHQGKEKEYLLQMRRIPGNSSLSASGTSKMSLRIYSDRDRDDSLRSQPTLTR